MKWMLHMVMLSVCSVEDFKEKEVALWKIAVYFIIILGYGIWQAVVSPELIRTYGFQMIFGAIPGIYLFILAKATDEAIGYADAWMTLIIGISMGIKETVGILSIAFSGAFVTALIFFIGGKKAKKKRIAFVPFLLLGMAGARL